MAKKKKSSGSSFNFKNFLVMNVEKLVFGGICVLAGLLAYMGFNTKPFSGVESPKKLQDNATEVSRSLKEDHWEAIKGEEGRIVSPVFFKAAVESMKPIPTDLYPAPRPPADVLARRRDPTLPAPHDLEVKYYYGPLAIKVAKDDPLDKLEDAKKQEKKGSKNTGSGSSPYGEGSSGGKGGMGGMGGMGGGGFSEGSSGMGDGMGMGDGPASTLGKRRMSFGYDLGFRLGMRTFQEGLGSGMGFGGGENMNSGPPGTPGSTGKVDPSKPMARVGGFVMVTALAPHHDYEEDYKDALYKAAGYMEGRDTPNYVGFEAQRVEITDPNKEIAESDWEDLPKANPSEFKKFIKLLAGSCTEVHRLSWTEPHISMPIPPILLDDYKAFATHSKLLALEEAETALAMGGAGGYAGGESGYGGAGYGGSGGPPGGSYGGYGGSGGPPGGSYGGGYPGGKGSSSSSEGFTEGSSGDDMAGGGMPGGGMGGGMGGKGMGGGMGGKGGGGAYGGAGVGTSMTVMEMPKKLPSTKYKLVRFYDQTAKPDKVYRYRVRLLMYDPNYPEWAMFKPDLSKLTLAALKRIQIQEQNEPKEPKEAKPAGTTSTAATPITPVKRTSRRESDWSAPSKPILVVKPAEIYMARKDDEKPECVFVDLEKEKAVYVPKKEQIQLGLVLGSKSAKNKDAIEIIHPISKVIKALTEFRSTTYITKMVTVIDSRGFSLLSVANAKDPLKSGMEIASFDPVTGQIVVSREFDNFTNFHKFVQPDSPAVGPLGGGLVSGGAAGAEGGFAGGGMGGKGGMGGMGAGGGDGFTEGGEPGGPAGGMGGGMGPKGGK